MRNFIHKYYRRSIVCWIKSFVICMINMVITFDEKIYSKNIEKELSDINFERLKKALI